MIDPDMKEVANKLLQPDEYKIELFLSTDGKHTVRYDADTPEGRKRGLEAAMALFDAIKKKYGTKADMWGKVMNSKKEEVIPNCPDCGKEMKKRKGKTGEFWGCSGYPECKGTRRVE